MKKIIVLILIYLVMPQIGYTFEDVILPQKGYEKSMQVQQEAEIAEAVSNEDFCEMERKVFKKTFQNDSAKNRLARLEKEVLGLEQKGDVQDRLDTLMTAMQYYESGYRMGENTNSQKPSQTQTIPKLNSWNYIQDYEFPDDYKNYEAKAKEYYSQPEITKDDVENYKQQSQSKIKRFLSTLADAFSGGVVTGFTPPIGVNVGSGNWNFDPFDGYSTFGGSSYVGTPSYINVPSYYNYNRPVQIYRPSNYYNSYYPRLAPNGSFNRVPHPHRIDNRTSNPRAYTTGSGSTYFNSGAKVKILY